jgi:signal transduction histidine kinase
MPGVRAEIRTFVDPKDGLLECVKRRPDVVLLDYMLGARTGLEVFSELTAARIDAPVILVTDQGSEEIAVGALHQGVSDYMQKDVAGPQALRRSILNSIERARLERALRNHREQLEGTIRHLETQNKEIQSFYHSLSHELKTPLTAVREFVSIVLDGVQGKLNADQHESLEIARAACDQMTAHINDIIDTSRIETGKLVLEVATQPIEPIVRQAIAHWSARAERKGIDVRWMLDEEGMTAAFDRQRMLQVLSNLIDNAVKFTDPGGAVSVAVEAQTPEFVTVAVRDNGCGIAPEDRDRIFDRLFQCRNADGAARQGMGLGLHLCRELIRSHGGRIEVRSEQGRGSEFTCWLPTRSQENQPRIAS